jgi:hypothetical protein
MDMISLVFLSMQVIGCFAAIVTAIGVSVLAVRALKN